MWGRLPRACYMLENLDSHSKHLLLFLQPFSATRLPSYSFAAFASNPLRPSPFPPPPLHAQLALYVAHPPTHQLNTTKRDTLLMSPPPLQLAIHVANLAESRIPQCSSWEEVRLYQRYVAGCPPSLAAHLSALIKATLGRMGRDFTEQPPVPLSLDTQARGWGGGCVGAVPAVSVGVIFICLCKR